MADGKVSIEELIELVEENSDNKKLKDAMKKLGVLKNAKLDLGIETGDLEKMRQSAEYLRLQADYLAQIGDREALREQVADNLKNLQEEYNKLALVDKTSPILKEIEALQKEAMEQAKDLGFAVDEVNNKILEMSPAAKQAQKEALPAFQNLARKMGMVSKTQDTMTASLIRGFTMIRSKDGLKGVYESFTSVFGVINVAESIVLKFVESTVTMVKEFDKARTSFAAATGAADKYNGALLQAQQQGNLLGVTFDNAGNAIKGMFEGFVGFVDMSESAQAALVQDVALLERIGVNAQTSSKMLTTFTRNLDMSADGAMHMTKALSQMGDEIGVSAQKMMSDFESAFKSLAVYGDQSIEVFQGLAAAAKAAGVEVATLTSIAGKFDTFSGAAESVGKLNALLGTQISSTEMLMMTEDQRIETLIQQVQLGGTNFKDMNKFQQMAIANAAGITDMAEAQRIFGMSFNEYGKYKDKMQAQNNVQENFAKAIEATLPFTEKFSMFAKEMAVAVQPLTDLFSGFLDSLLWFAKLGDGTVLRLTGMVSAFVLMKKILMSIGPIQKLYNSVKSFTIGLLKKENIEQQINNTQKSTEKTLTELGNKQREKEVLTRGATNGQKAAETGINGPLATSQTAVGNSSRFAAGGLLQMALGVAAVAAGIGIAAAGLGYFVQAFQGLNAEQLEAVQYALIGFGVAIITLVVVLALLAPKAVIAAAGLEALGIAMLTIGAGVALMGFGIFLAANGMATLVESLTKAGPMVLDFGMSVAYMGGGMLLAGVGVLAFAGAVFVLAKAGTLGAIGLGILALAFAGIGYGMSQISEGMKSSAENIANIVSSITTVLPHLSKLAEAMDSLSTISANPFGGGSIANSLKQDLEEISTLFNDSLPLQNGLENLALVVTGKSAKSMTEGAVDTITELKTAFTGLMEQKITISLDIKDSALSDMVEKVVVNGMDSVKKGAIYHATLKAVQAPGG